MTHVRAAEPGRMDGLLNGLLAAGTALLALVLGRLLSGRPGFLEAVSDGVLRYVPLDVFEAGLATFGPLAKGLLYAGVAFGVLVIGSVVGLALRRRVTRGGPVSEVTLVAASMVLLSEAVVLPLAGLGPFGTTASGEALPLHAPLIVAAVLFAVVLIMLRSTRTAGAPATTGANAERRAFLGRSLALIAAGSLAGSVLAVAVQVAAAARKAAASTGSFVGGFGPTPPLTPVEQFYRVDKNLFPTAVDASAWRLTIDGLVTRPQSMTLESLRAMPAQEAYRTLECISFEIVRGDTLIGNQRWRGVRVSELLDLAQPQPGAAYVLWEAEDGYTESIPIAVARHSETWIAYEMGGAPLTAEHGFPARVLIAGRFGMKQPKWLRRMTVSDHDESGYWEQRGWDHDAYVMTMSRIDHPRIGDEVPSAKPFDVFGIANSGDRRVEGVEVSPDGGNSWVKSDLEDASTPPLGPLTWVRWRATLTVPSPGPARLVVRATDGTDQVQQVRERPPLPSGSTGWHAIRVIAV